MVPTEEQRLIQESARKFAQERLAPHSAQWEQEAAFPRRIIEELGALGFMGMTVPAEWGGAGADHIEKKGDPQQAALRGRSDAQRDGAARSLGRRCGG